MCRSLLKLTTMIVNFLVGVNRNIFYCIHLWRIIWLVFSVGWCRDVDFLDNLIQFDDGQHSRGGKPTSWIRQLGQYTLCYSFFCWCLDDDSWRHRMPRCYSRKPVLTRSGKTKNFLFNFSSENFFSFSFYLFYLFFFEFDAQLFMLQFSCIALILSMMEIGMCVYISIHKNDFMKFVNDNFMDVYRVDAPAVQLMDYIQSTWKCCGKYGPLDWTLNIPPSCCKQPVTKGCNTNLITAGAAAFFGVGYKSSIYTEVTWLARWLLTKLKLFDSYFCSCRDARRGCLSIRRPITPLWFMLSC